MTKEEKAKAYDEALERAKCEIDTKGIGDTVELCKSLFPELRESEDEIIRNRLINLIRELASASVPIMTSGYFIDGQDKKYIAYLENLKDQPAEEDSSEKGLAECYLSKFDEKFPILPTLKGKQLADYKNFLNTCQQVLGLKEWGIHPTQAKLFAKLTLLWASWGAEHLQGIGAIDGDNEMDEEITLAYKIVPKFNIGDTILNTKTGDMCTIADRCLLYQYYSDTNHCHEIKFDEQDDWELVEQKEQKPVEWSEKEFGMLFDIEYYLNGTLQLTPDRKIKCISFLKSLRPQPKQQWSEEDKAHMLSLLMRLDGMCKSGATFTQTRFAVSEDMAWIRSLSLRQCSSWKPSEEQMIALDGCLEHWNGNKCQKEILKSLYEQLKKLM